MGEVKNYCFCDDDRASGRFINGHFESCPLFESLQEEKPGWEEEFDRKFVDTEGCQAGHERQQDCHYCKQWGGVEGEPKYDREPLASAGDIKSFVQEQISLAVQKERERTLSLPSMKKEVYSKEMYKEDQKNGDVMINKEYYTARNALRDQIEYEVINPNNL